MTWLVLAYIPIVLTLIRGIWLNMDPMDEQIHLVSVVYSVWLMAWIGSVFFYIIYILTL
jgi:hypothetical protein